MYRLDLFGEQNVTVSEFVNPSGVHFRSVNVAHSTCQPHDMEWQVKTMTRRSFYFNLNP